MPYVYQKPELQDSKLNTPGFFCWCCPHHPFLGSWGQTCPENFKLCPCPPVLVRTQKRLEGRSRGQTYLPGSLSASWLGPMTWASVGCTFSVFRSRTTPSILGRWWHLLLKSKGPAIFLHSPCYNFIPNSNTKLSSLCFTLMCYLVYVPTLTGTYNPILFLTTMLFIYGQMSGKMKPNCK